MCCYLPIRISFSNSFPDLAFYISNQTEKKNLNYVSIANEVYRELPEHDYKKPPHIGILFYRRFSLFSWHPRVDQDTPEEVCQKIMQSEIF